MTTAARDALRTARQAARTTRVATRAARKVARSTQTGTPSTRPRPAAALVARGREIASAYGKAAEYDEVVSRVKTAVTDYKANRPARQAAAEAAITGARAKVKTAIEQAKARRGATIQPISPPSGSSAASSAVQSAVKAAAARRASTPKPAAQRSSSSSASSYSNPATGGGYLDQLPNSSSWDTIHAASEASMPTEEQHYFNQADYYTKSGRSTQGLDSWTANEVARRRAEESAKSSAAWAAATQEKRGTSPGVTDQADITALNNYQKSLEAKRKRTGKLSTEEGAKLNTYYEREREYRGRLGMPAEKPEPFTGVASMKPYPAKAKVVQPVDLKYATQKASAPASTKPKAKKKK